MAGGVHFLGLTPRIMAGILEIPVYHMRGGTSTGIVLFDDHLPAEPGPRKELIRRIMGVPLGGEVSGNRQITGLGRGIPQSCKVFIVRGSDREDADIDSTLAQLAPAKAEIDWSVNCGNMSAALPLFASEVGLVKLEPGPNVVRIFNTNTDVLTNAVIEGTEPGVAMDASTRIPGVMGAWPGIQLSLLEPAGAKTGKLLPTGSARDVFDGLAASCVDLAVPMVILSASDLGKTASEKPEELDADASFKDRLRRIWIEAGLAMRLTRPDGVLMTEDELAKSETIPKICIVAPPAETEAAQGANIRVRYFTPQDGHKSMAVTGGACLAAGCLIPGSVAHEIGKGLAPLGAELAEHRVQMANPAGVLKSTIVAAILNGDVSMPSASYERSAQVLLRGHVPIYNASPELLGAYTSLSAA